MEITKTNPTLMLRKKLFEEMSDEDGNITRDSVKNILSENFHDRFQNELKEEYIEEYNEIQNIAQGMSGLDSIRGEDDISEETKVKILNASSLANIFQMYDVYYSVIMN